VIRELTSEIDNWEKQQSLYNHLRNLEYIRAEMYYGMDSSTTEAPVRLYQLASDRYTYRVSWSTDPTNVRHDHQNMDPIRKRMDQTVEAVNRTYNPYFGSLFQDGSKHSFFGMQVQRYVRNEIQATTLRVRLDSLGEYVYVSLFCSYADLYTSDCRNLLHYPFFYYYSAWPTLLPHQFLGRQADDPSLEDINK